MIRYGVSKIIRLSLSDEFTLGPESRDDAKRFLEVWSMWGSDEM